MPGYNKSYNIFTRKSCYFCRKKIYQIDFCDVILLHRFITPWSKIKAAKNTGTCAKHQRLLTQAIKRARFLALLPYVTR